MQTTLRLDDTIYRRAKAKSSELGISLTKFLEDAIEKRLQTFAAAKATRHVNLPVSSAVGTRMSSAELSRRIAVHGLEDDRKEMVCHGSD